MCACSECGARTTVLDSRKSGKTVRRRRSCDVCGHRHTTYEIPRTDERVGELITWVLSALDNEEEDDDEEGGRLEGEEQAEWQT